MLSTSPLFFSKKFLLALAAIIILLNYSQIARPDEGFGHFKAGYEAGLASTLATNSLAQERVKENNLGMHTPELTDEQKKTESFINRLRMNYIGDIPTEIIDVIGHYYQLKKGNLQSKNSYTSKNSNTLLLYGAPGKGKNALVEELSRALQVPYISCTALDFQNQYFGETHKETNNFFKTIGDYNKPLLVLIDEIDSSACTRQSADMGAIRNHLSSLLVNIEKVRHNKNICIFVATNHKEHLDSAILSRFSQPVEIKGLITREHYQTYFEKSCRDCGVTMPKQLLDDLATKVFNLNNYSWVKSPLRADYYSSRDYCFRTLESIIPTIVKKNISRDMRNVDEGKQASPKSEEELHTITDASLINAALIEVDTNYYKKLNKTWTDTGKQTLSYVETGNKIGATAYYASWAIEKTYQFAKYVSSKVPPIPPLP